MSNSPPPKAAQAINKPKTSLASAGSEKPVLCLMTLVTGGK